MSRQPSSSSSSPPSGAGQRSDRGRPREFDLGEATASASRVFWEQGYHATSIETLCNATGLLRGSLYAAFGDKHGLLIAAFENYADGAVARLRERLEADLPAHEALREGLLHYTRVANRLAGRHGCFITNTTLEMLPGDDDLRPHIEKVLRRIAALLAVAVTRGQRDGVFDARLDEQDAGNFLLCMIQGMRVLGKVNMSEKELVSIVDITMRALV